MRILYPFETNLSWSALKGISASFAYDQVETYAKDTFKCIIEEKLSAPLALFLQSKLLGIQNGNFRVTVTKNQNRPLMQNASSNSGYTA